MLLVAHVITGVAVGVGIPNPFLSAPVSFATHIVLDATPHWNFPIPKRVRLISFWQAFGPDMVLSILACVIAVMVFRNLWANVLWGVAWACLPDFLTLFRNRQPWKRWLKWFYKVHNTLQWEVAKGPGLAVQAFYLVFVIIVLRSLQ